MKEILIDLKKELVDNISVSLSNIIYNIFAQYYEKCKIGDNENILVNFQNILFKLTPGNNSEREKCKNNIINDFNNSSEARINIIYTTLIKIDILLIYEQLSTSTFKCSATDIENIIGGNTECNVDNITYKILSKCSTLVSNYVYLLYHKYTSIERKKNYNKCRKLLYKEIHKICMNIISVSKLLPIMKLSNTASVMDIHSFIISQIETKCIDTKPPIINDELFAGNIEIIITKLNEISDFITKTKQTLSDCKLSELSTINKSLINHEKNNNHNDDNFIEDADDVIEATGIDSLDMSKNIHIDVDRTVPKIVPEPVRISNTQDDVVNDSHLPNQYKPSTIAPLTNIIYNQSKTESNQINSNNTPVHSVIDSENHSTWFNNNFHEIFSN